VEINAQIKRGCRPKSAITCRKQLIKYKQPNYEKQCKHGKEKENVSCILIEGFKTYELN
jgi:hypothetical protein